MPPLASKLGNRKAGRLENAHVLLVHGELSFIVQENLNCVPFVVLGGMVIVVGDMLDAIIGTNTALILNVLLSNNGSPSALGPGMAVVCRNIVPSDCGAERPI
jgi:hypothetical protein